MMAFTISTRIMSRPLLRLLPSAQSVNVGLWHRCSVATASNHPHHPNPGNFSNRPKQELSEIGHKGGKKGGKATGVGGFHNMDSEKQHAIASKGGHAGGHAGSRAGGRAGARGKAVGNGETELEAEQHGRSHEPSVVAPGFEEWKTTA
ncbi:hypothetical protein DTO013E5_5359 [Penicillium roqueforti]|uniref:Stress-induced protein, KGG, repeat n=1 Tax=Penicillium roqueforti (strain FM164) TaxID=1365484 RepID=W6R1Y6_PENRF|nr:hypothetical protein CBS147337_9243 [Penicillium roqueforti]CDM35837.1 Stress-induced protein, KGG, repeat [Penicillium roqueforti FM164]KAI2672600.1 hypothetical protein CBS147355_7927 [Penicillium roqueforti]KAI2678908.1 hypothetical protein LCP963914a_7487 [Penicillium roqueforti]KAI2698958.1 hypothetical protein CBS147372_6805 [Penicillium roqueforti]